MNKNIVVLFLILMVLTLAGCGKNSGVEGKVVDGKGKPLSGVKLIAKQVEPIKGYERFETKTGSDGTFRFNKLYPFSGYILIPTSGCKTYKGGGFNDWRLPTKGELVALYKAGIRNRDNQIIGLSACCPWASKTRGSEAAHFHFDAGGLCYGGQSCTDGTRALPVRGDK